MPHTLAILSRPVKHDGPKQSRVSPFMSDSAVSQANLRVSDLPTPHLLLDRQKLRQNLARMAARADALGVRLRPHMKTSKSAAVAELALEGRPRTVTVSTMREARYFAEHGFRDIVLAVGIVPRRIEEALALIADGVDLAITTDEPATAEAIAAAGRAAGLTVPIMIEVDVGEHRGGVADPLGGGGARLLAVARAAEDRGPEAGRAGRAQNDGKSAGGARVRGILAHAGHTYGCTDRAAIAHIAETERAVAVASAGMLREAGFACPEVSVGSTPGGLFAEHLDGVTEMRPGVYMFMDLFQSGVGCCGPEDIALSVLSTVMNHRPEIGAAHIDAGGLALSKDRSTASQVLDLGFGAVTDVFGLPFPGVIVEAVHQEHGRLGVASAGPGASVPLQVLPVGGRVRVLPNHACMTAAAYDRYAVVDGTELGDEQPVVAFWDRVNGW